MQRERFKMYDKNYGAILLISAVSACLNICISTYICYKMSFIELPNILQEKYSSFQTIFNFF